MHPAAKNLFEKRFLDFQKLLVVKDLFLNSTAYGMQSQPKAFGWINQDRFFYQELKFFRAIAAILFPIFIEAVAAGEGAFNT